MSTRQHPARPARPVRSAHPVEPAAGPPQGVDVPKLTRRQLPALALVPREPICTLRFVGSDEDAVELPVELPRFFIGAGAACDVVVPRRLSPAVSACHALLERNDRGLVVRDLGSKNGTCASLAAPPRAVFDVQPGDTFWIAGVPVAVTDATLDVVRAHLICHLGILAEDAVEQAVRDVVSGQPLLLVGPEGTGARRLAGYIHAASPQRGNPRIVGLPPPYMLRHMPGMTVYVELDELPPLPARYAAALFDPGLGLRLIFAARDDRRAHAVLDHYRDRLRTLTLVPLARRREDVPHLMQFYWATRLGSRRSIDELDPDGLRALEAYDWPHNLDELYDHAQRILAYHEHGGLRRAAAALGIKHQTRASHLARIGYPRIDPAERELPLRPRPRRPRP